MTRLVWGDLSVINYESGVRRGVLYKDGSYSVWPGLYSVKEKETATVLETNYDFRKVYNRKSVGFFDCSINTLDVPEPFSDILGNVSPRPGFILSDQQKTRFDFSYQSMVNGLDYKIHLVYNAVVNSIQNASNTINSSVNPDSITLDVSAIPPILENVNAFNSSHFVVDSKKVGPICFGELEDILYGTEESDPRMPTIEELMTITECEEIPVSNGCIVSVMAFLNTGSSITNMDITPLEGEGDDNDPDGWLVGSVLSCPDGLGGEYRLELHLFATSDVLGELTGRVIVNDEDHYVGPVIPDVPFSGTYVDQQIWYDCPIGEGESIVIKLESVGNTGSGLVYGYFHVKTT